jgi:hypothetical protein
VTIAPTRLTSRLTSRILPVIAVGYIIAMLAFTVMGALDIGNYKDEWIHTQRLQNFLDHGMYVPRLVETWTGNFFPDGGNPYAYSPIFAIVGHVFAVLAGAETWSTVSQSIEAYQARHIAVVFFSVIGLVATGWAVTIATRSKRWGIYAAALLVSLPIWTGTAMFNVKDAPEAAGYMLLTAGFIALTWLGPTPTMTRRVLGWLAIVAGTVVSVGIRPGIWPGVAIAFVGVGILIAWLGTEPGQRVRTTATRLGLVGFAIAAGYAVLALVYPYLFGNPLFFAINSFRASSDFPHETYVLFDGELNGMPPRWYYLPKLLLAQLPELMIVIIVGTSLFAGWILVKKLRNRRDNSFDAVIPALGFALVQSAAFPIAAILLDATVYGGIRQFLFIIPALVVIGTIGLFLLTQYLSARNAIRSTRIVAGVVAASVTLTTFSATQMYPYVSDYFNPTNVARGIDNRWDVDRWRMGFWETYNQLPVEAQERCINTGGVDRPCWDLEHLLIRKPSTPMSGTNPVPLRANEKIQIGWMREVSSNCRIVGGISRPYLWTSISLDTVRACDFEVDPYTSEPRAGTVQNRRWWKNHTAWGWANSSIGTNGVVSLPRHSASLGFGLTEQMLTSDVRISVSLSLVPRDEKSPLFVNLFANDVLGATVKVRDDSRRNVTFTVPSETVMSLDVDSLFVAFTVVDGSGDRVASGIYVESISVEPILPSSNRS